MTVRLQPLTRARVASLGERGEAWAESLPRRLAELARDWGLDLGRSLPGGSNS
jgi:streptomycin 6-kinase